jgi:hypothetical protein
MASDSSSGTDGSRLCHVQGGTSSTTGCYPPPASLSQIDSTDLQESATAKAKLPVTYAKVPSHFEPQQGQTDERVHFLARGNRDTLFLTSTEAVLALRTSHNDFRSKRE